MSFVVFFFFFYKITSLLLQAILPQIQIVTETATTYEMKEPSVCSLWMSTLPEIPRPGGLFKLNHPHLPWYRHSPQVSRSIALGGFSGAPLLGTQVGAGAAGPLGHPPTNWRLTRHANLAAKPGKSPQSKLAEGAGDTST